MTIMNQDVKTKWVAALRSGQYKQTQSVLRRNGHHCCLGVLCEVSNLETGFGIKENNIEGDGEYLCNTIQDWAGLPFMTGDSVIINDMYDKLTNHNDDGRTFLEIADAIEAQL